MGQFLYNGKNKIMDDLIAKLPNGTAYLKEKNIIPYIEEITYTEQFLDYAAGTKVDIFVDNQLITSREVLDPHKTIYAKFKTPYNKFTLRTEINGEVYQKEEYYALNIFTFFEVMALVFNYDYREIFNIFGNLYDKYLQDDWLYNKVGWYYNFSKPYGWSTEDYRRVLVGSGTSYLPLNQLFLNAMTIESVKEVIKNVTTAIPTISTYRDTNEWILPTDDELLVGGDYDKVWILSWKRQYTYEDAEPSVIDLYNDETNLYSEQYLNNTINITVNKASHQIIETVMRGNSTQDKLKHKYILNTISYPISVVFESTTYVDGVDFNLVENIIGSDEWYIEWIGAVPPILNSKYTVTYNYLLKEEVMLLVEQIKPATLKIDYTWIE